MSERVAAQARPSPPASMVLRDLVARHADEAAQLWSLRDAAVRSSTYDLPAIVKIDDRVEAQLDGLRIAGEAGWEACRAGLVAPGAGEIFAAAVLAVERAEVDAIADLIALGEGAPLLGRGLISALGWVPFAEVRGVLEQLLADDAPPALHRFGIAGAAAHRHDPGPRLAEAVRLADPAPAARALRAVGELGRGDLLPALRRRLEDDDEACRFWAAWSAALLGEPAAHAPLLSLSRSRGPFAERALTLLVRAMNPAAARAELDALADSAGSGRIALLGAAALGDPALLPWVVAQMSERAQARRAGWVFTQITGVDLFAQRLSAEAPPGFSPGPSDDPRDPDVALDPDEGLPWPDPVAVQAFMDRRGAALPAGTRHLLGQPMDPGSLSRVLRHGAQPARTAAALELSLRQAGRPLFALRAPGPRQARLLAPV